MARPYLLSFFGRGDDPFGSLFREVQKTFEDFLRARARVRALWGLSGWRDGPSACRALLRECHPRIASADAIAARRMSDLQP
jgi:hypothetical protein